MKACRDCIHVGPINESGFPTPRCLHPKSYIEVNDYLYGTTRTIVHTVETMRTLGACGPEATLFAAKEE
jgi:hypothetical protein